MDNYVSAVCEIISGPEGDKFLGLIREAYAHRPLNELISNHSREMLDQAVNLGLLVPKNNHVDLTASGFLVGNVAKEYCNWIDYNRHMPPPRPPTDFFAGKDVLDLGCSIGRWLWEFQAVAKSVFGIEFRNEYIELGRALARRENIPAPPMLHGSIDNLEQLVPPKSADFIFCRLVMNHVPIKKNLRKMTDTLRTNGILWLEIESLRFVWNRLFNESKTLKEGVFSAFGIFNSYVCMATGRQLNFPFHGRHQSAHWAAYPSMAWWRQTLANVGLTDIHSGTDTGPQYIWGRKLKDA